MWLLFKCPFPERETWGGRVAPYESTEHASADRRFRHLQTTEASSSQDRCPVCWHRVFSLLANHRRFRRFSLLIIHGFEFELASQEPSRKRLMVIDGEFDGPYLRFHYSLLDQRLAGLLLHDLRF